ncbi:hypothetical protein L1987_75954 [Smallanthus sonchifolius]|uniref:Uncharacterized protein n=1 Tax=Smallanthus sonchifolius TaxID=185202 RepID=A0ACB9A7E1_9ASTR|nr:hypothetical protein L1987_75954 [Smallanthus sonchifolius]
MESGDRDYTKAFPIGETPQETGLSYVPKCYELSSSDKPSLTPEIADVEVIDLAGLDDPVQHPAIVKKIGNACRESGFFQHYAHPLNEWIQQWPNNPSDYR